MEIWDIEISAPTGDISARLELSVQDGAAVGAMSGKGGSGPAEKLVWTPDTLAWFTKIQKPMPMMLKFKGVIEAGTVTGTVKFGIFASGTFVGRRVVAPA